MGTGSRSEMMRITLSVAAATALIVTSHVFAGARSDAPKPVVIDAASLRHKVLCGYQGWFRCPGDPAGEGWRHWSRNDRRIGPDTLTFEMWPDMSELGADEKFAAPG